MWITYIPTFRIAESGSIPLTSRETLYCLESDGWEEFWRIFA